MASQLTSYLPPFEGLLPKWLLLLAIVSIGNSIQAYTTIHYTWRVYTSNSDNSAAAAAAATSPSYKPAPSDTPSQVTPLSSRKFGTWTFLASIVRLYAAYHVNEPAMYDLAVWTYGVAWAHFVSEWVVFGTSRWGLPLAGPLMVSTGSLVWMYLQREFYLGQ